MTPFVRGATLSNYVEVAQPRSGWIRCHAMLGGGSASTRRVADQDPDLRIPADSVVELLEASALASGCETFGLRMAESRQLADFGAVSLLITHQATMRDALMTLVHVSLLHLLNEALAMHSTWRSTAMS